MEVDFPPVFINSLHVVQKSSGKCRLTLDLSSLNKLFWNQSVLYEDNRTVLDLFLSGYFSSPSILNPVIIASIFPDHQQYLGFS